MTVSDVIDFYDSNGWDFESEKPVTSFIHFWETISNNTGIIIIINNNHTAMLYLSMMYV